MPVINSRTHSLYFTTMVKLNRVSITVLLVGVCGTFIMAKPNDAPISPNLKLVAIVDGKSYFADSSRRSWTAAKDYCTSFGMNLAEITSKAQFDALNAAYAPDDFAHAHWIAGRDAHLPRQFSWDSTGDSLSNEYFTVDNWAGIDYETCLFYYSRPNNSSRVYFYPCRSTVV